MLDIPLIKLVGERLFVVVDVNLDTFKVGVAFGGPDGVAVAKGNKAGKVAVTLGECEGLVLTARSSYTFGDRLALTAHIHGRQREEGSRSVSKTSGRKLANLCSSSSLS